MQIDLSGKNILVTGASRGIGKEIALTLAQSGARVVVHFNHSSQAASDVARECGHGAVALQANLEHSEEVSGLFEASVASCIGLDGLVNNAAVAIESPLESEDWLQDWERTMRINSSASAQLSRLAIQHFQNRGGGRLLHIVSRAAHRGDTADYLAYASSKGALLALSKSLARAYGKDDIYSFAIAPGFVNTDMAQDFIAKYGESYVIDDTALNQMTQPEHVAQICPLLFSGRMDHATGTTIDINAGSYIR